MCDVDLDDVKAITVFLHDSDMEHLWNPIKPRRNVWGYGYGTYNLYLWIIYGIQSALNLKKDLQVSTCPFLFCYKVGLGVSIMTMKVLSLSAQEEWSAIKAVRLQQRETSGLCDLYEGSYDTFYKSTFDWSWQSFSQDLSSPDIEPPTQCTWLLHVTACLLPHNSRNDSRKHWLILVEV